MLVSMNMNSFYEYEYIICNYKLITILVPMKYILYILNVIYIKIYKL